MIRHIVLFKFSDKTAESDKQKLAEDLEDLLEKTDGLMLECEVAFDVAKTERSYDLVLNSLFENMETLDKYRVHPEHAKVLEFIKQVCSSTAKIDYAV
jgi:hypothetical protein